MCETRNVKFSTMIDLGKYMSMTKYPLKGRGQRPLTKKLNFKPPSVNLERVKLETSNLVY